MRSNRVKKPAELGVVVVQIRIRVPGNAGANAVAAQQSREDSEFIKLRDHFRSDPYTLSVLKTVRNFCVSERSSQILCRYVEQSSNGRGGSRG